MKLVCIRQPGYLPYMGFFKKIQSSDIFIYLDDTKFVEHGWDNRNKIKTDKGSMWLTVPIKRDSIQLLKDVLIANNESWKKKHLKSIKINYTKAPFFNDYWDDFSDIFQKDWNKLIDLNLNLIKYFNQKLEIITKTIRSSELQINSSGTKRLVEICQHVGATTYLSGILGKEYLDEDLFNESGIKIIYENFIHPIYKQLGNNFLPNMSIIDLLFNEGPNSGELIRKSSNF
jgi:hypothetical protein